MPLGETLLEFLGELFATAFVEGVYHGHRRLGARLRSWVIPDLTYAQALKRRFNFLLGLGTVVLLIAICVVLV
jgi:hypothetical protein